MFGILSRYRRAMPSQRRYSSAERRSGIFRPIFVLSGCSVQGMKATNPPVFCCN